MLFALFDWFKTLKNLEKSGKNEAEIHAVFRKYCFTIMTMETNIKEKKSLYFLSCLKKFQQSLTLQGR